VWNIPVVLPLATAYTLLLGVAVVVVVAAVSSGSMSGVEDLSAALLLVVDKNVESRI
jgi:hypothetical protein